MWQVSVFDLNKQQQQRVSLAEAKCLHVGNNAKLPQDVTWDESLQDIFVKGATEKANQTAEQAKTWLSSHPQWLQPMHSAFTFDISHWTLLCIKALQRFKLFYLQI
eukprot:g7268.t1